MMPVCSRARCLLPVLMATSPFAPTHPAEIPEGQDSTCQREAVRSVVVAVEIEIGDREPPCRIEFHDTAIKLEAVADASRPDPGRTVVVDSRGRFISTNAPGWEGVISVWDPQGRYLSSFGGEGDGSAGFSRRGILNLMIDARDNVHVRDGSPGWWVFSAEHELIRRVPADVMGGLFGKTVILDNGSALASDGVLFEPTHHFRVADSTGALASTFGPVGNGSSSGREMREITYAGGDTFWAGPGERGAEAYVLEEWGTDGELLRTLRRKVPWWQWRGERRISTTVRRLHITRDGLLYVLVRRPTDEYVRQYARTEERGEVPDRSAAESMAGLVDFVLEVIDSRSGRLLASEVYPQPQVGDIVPSGLFRGSLMGYRHRVGDDGLAFVEFVTVELVSRRGGETEKRFPVGGNGWRVP